MLDRQFNMLLGKLMDNPKFNLLCLVPHPKMVDIIRMKFEAIDIPYTFYRSHLKLIFRNGSKIEFIVDGDDLHHRVNGREYDRIWIDETVTLPDNWENFLIAREKEKRDESIDI